MKSIRKFGWSLGLLTAALIAAAPAQAANVVIAGDSWAAFQGPEYAANFPAGVSVNQAGIAGMTASVALATGYVNNVIALAGGANHVLISLGGNDTIAGASAAQIDADLRGIINSVNAQFPGIQIVLPGYDFPNFEKDTECQILGLAVFGNPLAIAVNPIFLAKVRDVQAAVAASYANVTAIDAFGTLQAAGGIPGAPNIIFPSPSAYMGGNGDCIHTNSTGDNIFTDKIYDLYFAAIYGPRPGGGGCAIVAAPGDDTMSAALSSLILLVPAAAFVIVGRRRRS
ncbi:MAG: SGNH/GDSL hydrolase family protein [Myxococcales bacterium]|nr:SGNH/GDSL hydrolase family protein [Myxococcales bacterium]